MISSMALLVTLYYIYLAWWLKQKYNVENAEILTGRNPFISIFNSKWDILV